MLSSGKLLQGWNQECIDELTFVVPHMHEVSGFQTEQLQPGFQVP